MRAWLARARHFVSEALDEWRHSVGVNALATATIAAVLLGGGLVLLVVFNVDAHARRLRAEARVAVYLRDDAGQAERGELLRLLAATPGVVRVDYVDKVGALERFRSVYGEAAALAGELEGNPLPASFEAVLAEDEAARETARAISAAVAGKPGVEEVRFDGDWLDRLDALLGAAKAGGALAGVFVLAAVVLVTGSVLRLAVLAHAEEVEIMLLVGASPMFVRAPFLVAGFVQGCTASAVALSALEAARRLALAWAPEPSGIFLRLVAGAPLPLGWSAALAAAGIAAAMSSALFAFRRV